MDTLRTVSFKQAPCRCVTVHVPKPVDVELHHVMPQSDQRRLWGRVKDRRTVPLCGTAHTSVHAYLDWLLGRRKTKPNVGPYIRHIAGLGFTRIREAEQA